MSEPRQPQLLHFFRELPQRRDNETTGTYARRFRAGMKRFQKQAEERYTEATLYRLLGSDCTEVRRAAVMALGMLGSMNVNEALADMLHDEDPNVRQFAGDALWSIWFRADAPENNQELQRLVRKSLEGVDSAEILSEFEGLLTRAPHFAEAFNQRAVFQFRRGDYAKAIADCQRVLKINPYHFGAASGLAQCYLKQKKYRAALRTYRRTLSLNPNLDSVREAIDSLEKLLGEEGRK
jgi:tetratricopeptide (TPR) repeat protein